MRIEISFLSLFYPKNGCTVRGFIFEEIIAQNDGGGYFWNMEEVDFKSLFVGDFSHRVVFNFILIYEYGSTIYCKKFTYIEDK